MAADLFDQALAMGGAKEETPQPEQAAAMTRTTQKQSKSATSRNPFRKLLGNRSVSTTTSSTQGATQRQGGKTVDYDDFKARYAALGQRAIATGVNPLMIQTRIMQYEEAIRANRTIARGRKSGVKDLEGAIETFEEEVEYLEGRSTVMSASLGAGYGGGYVAVGPRLYGGYGGFGLLGGGVGPMWYGGYDPFY